MLQKSELVGQGTSFRTDINGLRAWAVMVVVLYHFGVPGFTGGFVGVDVFFVISGFLMTSIIIGGLDRGGGDGFSLLAFYLARAKRILPALVVLCAVLLALGWLALPSPDYATLATHTLASLAFLSNVKFWREAGYFDVASHDKWLLHTWSLSVEWQFYLLLPIGLMLLWRCFPQRRAATRFVGGLLVLSLLLSIGVTTHKPDAAFYLLPTRAWEMLAGGLIFLLGLRPQHRLGRWLELAGFALILLSVATADATVWPGYHAVLPVLGSCLVLIATRAQSGWTSPTVMQALGRWSYSVYLWHWPVVVALAYLERAGEPIAVALGLGLSVILGGLSYRWVEAPVRSWLGHGGPWPALQTLALATLIVAVPAGLVRLSQGAPGRLSPAVELAANEATNFNLRRTACHTMAGEAFKRCVYGGPNVRIILVGDSHASSVVTALQAALPSASDGVLAFSYTSCPTLFGARLRRTDLQCGEFNDWVLQQISELPAHVPVVVVNRSSAYLFGNEHILGSATQPPSIYFTDPPPREASEAFLGNYKHRLVASACTLAQQRPVYLVRPFPEMTQDVPRTAARKLLLGKPVEIGISLDAYHARHAFIWSAQDTAKEMCGIEILDPLPWLCADGECGGTEVGRPRYYDDNHLSESGNRSLVGMFNFVAELKRSGSSDGLGNHPSAPP